MKNHLSFFQNIQTTTWVVGGIALASLAGLGYLGYTYKQLSAEYKAAQRAHASTTAALEENIRTLSDLLAVAKTENENLNLRLTGEVARNDDYNRQIASITSTVGELYKLSKTDKELLQKYSNVYFLNENYIPSELSPIPTDHLLRKEKIEIVHTKILPYLDALIRAANADLASSTLLVLSAYRSFDTQTSLKQGYKVVYGTTAANKFSADQGYSEHQLGSTVDLTTQKGGEVLSGFDKTTAYAWLLQNAHTYGFILSYPKNNKFYQFEPWHWRFVGVELATRLHTEGKYFYDFDQRTINEYLGKIFN